MSHFSMQGNSTMLGALAGVLAGAFAIGMLVLLASPTLVHGPITASYPASSKSLSSQNNSNNSSTLASPAAYASNWGLLTPNDRGTGQTISSFSSVTSSAILVLISLAVSAGIAFSVTKLAQRRNGTL